MPPASEACAFPGFEIPTDRNGQLWIHFAPHDPARYVSANDVIEGRVRPTIAAELVLIGTSAVGLLDIKTTPLDPAMPGVEIHAQILESMFTRRCCRAELGGRRRTVAALVLGVRHHLACASA